MQIHDNILIAECSSYDFKEMLERKKVKSWLKSVSAFANTDGGSLFYGVNTVMGGEVHIDIYDDRVELVSPGAMLDGTQIQDRDIYKKCRPCAVIQLSRICLLNWTIWRNVVRA